MTNSGAARCKTPASTSVRASPPYETRAGVVISVPHLLTSPVADIVNCALIAAVAGVVDPGMGELRTSGLDQRSRLQPAISARALRRELVDQFRLRRVL